LDVIPLAGQNLFEDSYKLLIRPGADNADIMVAVLALNAQGQSIGFDRLRDPVGFLSGKVLEWDLEIGSMDGVVSEEDNNCISWIDENGEPVHLGLLGDEDCDGYTVDGGDCNDLNPDQHPGQREDCNNGIDDDCNGFADEADLDDRDGDGYFACGEVGARDCNNDDAEINPGAQERCDGVDNNCNGSCDDGFDEDGDGVTFCGSVIGDGGRCIDMGDPDCNPGDADVFPGNDEVCDGKDNDCSGSCDDDSNFDQDEDGYTICGSVVGECGVENYLVDCDDNRRDIHPGQTEFCDGVDNNCVPNDEPITSPCVVSPNGEPTCLQGQKSCVNGVLVGECVDTVDTPIDFGFCENYEQCQVLGDPLMCLLNGDGLQVQPDEVCQVSVVGDEQCEQNVVQIVSPVATDLGDQCTYSLVGGALQQGYQLNIVDGNGFGGSANSVNSCLALLQAIPLPGAGRAVIAINLHIVGDTDYVIGVKLDTHRRAECGPAKGLECQTWQNVGVQVQVSNP